MTLTSKVKDLEIKQEMYRIKRGQKLKKIIENLNRQKRSKVITDNTTGTRKYKRVLSLSS